MHSLYCVLAVAGAAAQTRDSPSCLDGVNVKPSNKRQWWLAHGWLVDDLHGTLRPGTPAAASEVRVTGFKCLNDAVFGVSQWLYLSE